MTQMEILLANSYLPNEIPIEASHHVAAMVIELLPHLSRDDKALGHARIGPLAVSRSAMEDNAIVWHCPLALHCPYLHHSWRQH